MKKYIKNTDEKMYKKIEFDKKAIMSRTKKIKEKKPSKNAALNKKLKEYKEVLKDDEDWDWSYIIKLLKYKLERTRKCILKNDFIMDAEKVGRQIRQVEDLLDRVDKDNYFEEISRDFYKKYGKLKMISEKSDFGKNFTSVTFKFAKETPQNRKRIHAQHLRLMIKAEKMQRDELKKAFELMHKNIWNWWD